MIAFGCSVTKPEIYERCAEPGIRLVAEPDSEIISRGSTVSLFRTYNVLLDLASRLQNLEALVLVHQDAEIIDRDFLGKVREALSDPDVAVVGCAGSVGVHNIAWWEGSVTWASFTHRFDELGGGEIPALAWLPEETPSYATTGEVDTIDGFVMCLSPWAIRELRFDESLGQAIHGYDFDYCLQARAAGRKVVTADLKVVHHHDLQLIRDVENWMQAHMTVAEKWDGRIPGVGDEPGDWKQRARRAEADASAQRMITLSERLYRDTRIAALEGELTRTSEALENCRRQLTRLGQSASWRATAPVRALSRRLGRSRSSR
jgi:hypothetical protein